jgi:predicted N-acetyltransferase YhbS
MSHAIIRLETEKDYRAVEELTREAFGTSTSPVRTSIISYI